MSFLARFSEAAAPVICRDACPSRVLMSEAAARDSCSVQHLLQPEAFALTSRLQDIFIRYARSDVHVSSRLARNSRSGSLTKPPTSPSQVSVLANHGSHGEPHAQWDQRVVLSYGNFAHTDPSQEPDWAHPTQYRRTHKRHLRGTSKAALIWVALIQLVLGQSRKSGSLAGPAENAWGCGGYY